MIPGQGGGIIWKDYDNSKEIFPARHPIGEDLGVLCEERGGGEDKDVQTCGDMLVQGRLRRCT